MSVSLSDSDPVSDTVRVVSKGKAPEPPPCAVFLVPAAGRGRRMGKDQNKIFLPLQGEPLIVHLLRRLRAVEIPEDAASRSGPPRIVLITRPEEVTAFDRIFREAGMEGPDRYVAGGATRQASVYQGLEALEADGLDPATPVLIHDAARALVPPSLLADLLQRTARGENAAPALPVQDTLRRVTGTDEAPRFGETVPRDGLVRMQTPQTAPLGRFLEVHRAARRENVEVTDDVALLRRGGYEVTCVPGCLENLKITRPEDLRLAVLLLADGC